jgi:hypothetical protein
MKLVLPGVRMYERIMVLSVWLCLALDGRSATIWDGPMITFSESTTDPTLAINQDRITANVWITRGPIQGIFNAKTETSFTHFSSPADTRWANGNLTNYALLTYTDWNTWAKGVNPGPPSTVGVDAVVHLISDDIYLGLKFTFWGGAGGLFAYQRTTPHVEAAPNALAISRFADTVVLTWTNAAFALQAAPDASATFTNLPGATSPYTNSIRGPGLLFRLKP